MPRRGDDQLLTGRGIQMLSYQRGQRVSGTDLEEQAVQLLLQRGDAPVKANRLTQVTHPVPWISRLLGRDPSARQVRHPATRWRTQIEGRDTLSERAKNRI